MCVETRQCERFTNQKTNTMIGRHATHALASSSRSRVVASRFPPRQRHGLLHRPAASPSGAVVPIPHSAAILNLSPGTDEQVTGASFPASLGADEDLNLATSYAEKTAIQKILYPEPEELPENFEVGDTCAYLEP